MDELKESPVKRQWAKSIGKTLEQLSNSEVGLSPKQTITLDILRGKKPVPGVEKSKPFAEYLGKTPEFFENVAYGNDLTKAGDYGLPKLKESTRDAIMVGADLLPGAGKALGAGAKLADRASAAALRKMTGNAAATPARVVDEINQMNLMPQIFVGKRSKTWDKSKEAEALRRLGEGEDAAKTWQETGYGVAPWDKAPRTEISDKDIKFKTFPMDREVKLGTAVSHPELEKAYPEMFDETRMNYASPSKLSGFNGGMTKTPLGEDLLVLSQRQGLGEKGKSTTAHELSHLVQGKEGHASGGTPEMFMRDIADAEGEVEKVNKQMSAIVKSMDAAKASGDVAKYDKYKAMYDDAMDYKLSELVPKAQANPDDQYRRLAGEAEARLTQYRMNLTPEERLAQYPYEPEYFKRATGVPIDELITKYGSKNSAEKQSEIVNSLRDKNSPNSVQSAVKEDEHGYRRITGPVGSLAQDASGQTRPDVGRVRGLIEDSEARGYRGRGNNSDELAAVKQLIDNPDQNPAVQLARQFNPSFDPRIVNSMPGSSMVKQMPIAKLYDTMYDVGNVDPKMQAAVFASYLRNMPDVVRKSGATNYNELTEAAYEQLRKETQQQFDAMRNAGWNMSYHNDGRGNYHNSQEMLIDLLRNKHLYTFGGGDVHPGLNAINPETGLNSNEMFRAVHDALGHGTTGSSFGRKGEELAYGAHGDIFSPLAKIAAGTETRGQNSFVNYSGINAQNRYKNAKLNEDFETARRRGQDTSPIAAALRKNGEEWQYAPQSAFLLPPEVLDINYRGGMPDYMTPYIKPSNPTNMPGYHWSHNKLSMTDPRYSGTGIKGEERERAALPGYNKGTYFYDNPNSREPGLGPNQHGAHLEDMYDLKTDPEKVGITAFVENFDPKKGTSDHPKSLNDREQAILDLGYRGYKGQGGAVSFFPEAVNFLRKAD